MESDRPLARVPAKPLRARGVPAGHFLPETGNAGSGHAAPVVPSTKKKALKKATFDYLSEMVGREGFEPSTKRLKVFCSTD